MNDEDIFRPEWLAFEKDLGFRPLLHGPTYENLVKQDTEIGLALASKLSFPSPEPSVKFSEDKTSSGIRPKVYTPAHAKPNKPVVLYMHGGGCVLGSVDENDYAVSRYATETSLVFVSVEYRLAPQYPHPAGLDDCYEAANWCIDHGHTIGGQARKVILMGVSAGATLALATGLRLTKEGRRGGLEGVVAISPFTLHPDAIPEEFQKEYTSYEEHAEHTMNTKQCMKTVFDLHGADPTDRSIFIALSSRIKDLPCVYLSFCSVDTLRDDARILLRLLKRYGRVNTSPFNPQTYHTNTTNSPNSHCFFAYPSPHLTPLRNTYFAKTAAGINFILDSSIQTPLPLC